MKDEEIANWYVLRVKTGCEKKIGLALHKRGFSVLFPLKRELREWSDRKKYVEVALFKSYIFIELKKSEKNQVFVEKNILGYLKISEELCKLREDEVRLIKSLTNLENVAEITYGDLCKGVLVEVLSGFLCGFQGEVVEVRGRKRLHIKIVNLNCSAIFILEGVELKVLDI